MFNFPAASPHFYSTCDARCHGAAVSSPRRRNGREGGGGRGAKACHGLKHHASFHLRDSAGYPVDGSLGHEGADLFSSLRRALDLTSRHTAGKKIHLNKSFNLVSFE